MLQIGKSISPLLNTHCFHLHKPRNTFREPAWHKALRCGGCRLESLALAVMRFRARVCTLFSSSGEQNCRKLAVPPICARMTSSAFVNNITFTSRLEESLWTDHPANKLYIGGLNAEQHKMDNRLDPYADEHKSSWPSARATVIGQ